MPFLRRTVRSRTCVAAAKAAAAAKARLSPTKAKTAKKQTPVVSPRSVINEAAKSSSSQKDQGGAKDKAAASEGARDSSTQKDQSVSKARAAASEEAKGPSNQKDHGVAKAKVASVATARVSGQGGGEGKAASEEAKQGGAVTRLRKSVRNSDGASTSTARTISPTRSDDESVDDPDCVEAKRPRLSVCSPPDLKKRSGTTAAGVEKTSEEHEMRGQGRLRQLQRFRGTGRLDTGDGEGAGGGSWNTAGSEAREPQASSMAPPAGSEGKRMKLDESFDPFDPSLRQPVLKEKGTAYKCSVSQCPLSTRECAVGLWLFALPCKKTYAKLRADWEASIKIDPKINHPLSPRVCFRHFAKTDFVSRKQRLLGLEEYAVPTIQVPGEAKKPCSYTTIFRQSSSQPSQSVSPKGASDSSAAKAGKNVAVASPCSTVNSASGLTARSSRSRGPQPDASTQPESKPERKSDPDTATSSVLSPDASLTSPVRSVPASTRGSRSTRSTAKSSIATASKREDRTAVARQTLPSAEVAPPEAELASVDGSMQQSSAKGSQSTRLPPKSSIATTSKSEKRTIAARPTPPSAVVAPPEVESASNDGSMPALTRGSQNAKPPQKSSIATASKSEKRTTAASQTPPIAEVAPIEVESDSDDGSVPASAKGSQSTRPPPESSITTASENIKTSVVAGQTPLSAKVVPSKAASTSAVRSAPASTKGTGSAKPPPKSSVATGSEKENTTVVASQTPAIAKVAPLKADYASDNGSVPASTKGSLSAKPRPKSSVATASEKENTSVAAGQKPLSAEVMPSNTASTSAVRSVAASAKSSQRAKPPPKSSVTTASANENTSVAAGQTPPSAEVVPSKAALTSAVRSVPASTKDSQSAKPAPKSSVTTASSNKNTSVAAGQSPLSAEVVPSKIASTSAVPSMPASTKDSQSAKPPPKSSVTTASEKENTSVAAGQTPPSAEVVPSNALSTSAVRTVPASTKVSQSAKPPPKSSVAAESKTENTTVLAGETPGSADVAPQEAESASNIGSAPASPKGSTSTKLQPESSIATVSEMDNSTVTPDKTLSSARVMPLEAALDSDISSMPASAKHSPSTKPQPEPIIAVASGTGNSCLAIGQTPLSTEVSLSKVVSTSDVGSVPASVKCSPSSGAKPIIATVSDTDNGTVVTGKILLNTELVSSKAVLASGHGSVTASAKCSPHTKQQPDPSFAIASETGNSIAVTGEKLRITEVVPPEGASASDVRPVPASAKGSPSTKLQPESSIGTASQTGDSTVEAVRTPPCTEVVPQPSSSALESTPTIHADLGSAAKDCLASTVLNAGSKATAAPMSSSGIGSIPVPETAATVGSSPAAGDAAVPAADAISMPAEEAMSDLTSEMESTHDTLPDSTATGDSSTVVESAEPAAADELTAVTGNIEKLETASTSGASVVSVSLMEDSSKTVEDSESTVCAGLAERDSLAPEGRAMSKAAPSESPEQNDSCVQLRPRPERRRRSSSSASDATESPEDCSSPRAQLSPSGRKPAKRRCRKSLKRAGDEEAASIGISPPLPLGAVSSKARETVSTVGAKSLPEAGSTPAVVYKSEPGTIKSEPATDFSCSTAAVALENLEPHPSPATTLSYSSDTDLEESATPEVFSGRVFDPSDGSYVIEREIVGERDDFGMSAVFYRVSWAPR